MSLSDTLIEIFGHQIINGQTDSQEFIKEIIDEYNDIHNTSHTWPDISQDGLSDIARWMNKESYGGPLNLVYKAPQLIHAPVYSDIASKLNWLKQQRCSLCNVHPLRHFPLEVTPWSHQSKSGIKGAVMEAINKYSEKRELNLPIYPDETLCVKLIFIIAKSNLSIKDCDNLAKGILDSFEGYLYTNDRQIDHLDLLRINASETEGYMLISATPTAINNHEDVINKVGHAKIAWMDSESLWSQ